MEFTLGVGQTGRLMKSLTKASVALTYAGMPNTETFSVAIWWSLNNNSLAYNLYLSRDQKSFDVPRGKIYVSSVSPELIRLSFKQE
jgi:hypothetical protein